MSLEDRFVGSIWKFLFARGRDRLRWTADAERAVGLAEPLIGFVIERGGGTDTIGAKNGVAALPQDLLAKLEARDEIEKLARALFACPGRP